MHLHLGAGLLILLIVALVIFPYYGWALIVWPVAVIAGCVALYFAARYTLRRARELRHRHARRAIALRRDIARLEAEQGIPLLTEGTCAACGKPLIAEARFCSYCKTPTRRTARVCEGCGTRNAGDARWCGACGASLAESDAETDASAEPVPTTWRAAIADTIADLLDAAVD